MKRIFILVTGICIFSLSYSQPFRYSTKIFNETDTIKGVEYATAPWLDNPISLLSDYNIHDGESKTQNRPLLMDIFMPHGDTLNLRPAIIFVHSGAFLTGSRLNDDMVALCDSFARRGYVTATIDYRLGMGAEFSGFTLSVTSVNAIRAMYRGVQDGRAAIRFLKHNSEVYGIDTTRIYMAGSSAGAIVALLNVYMNNRDEIPPETLETPSLGGLDTVGIAGTGSVAGAVVSMWGAVQDTSVIDDDSTPVFLIHGETDDVVPFREGVPLANTVPENPFISFTMPPVYGSYCIDTILNNRGFFHETYFVEGKGHEFYGVKNGEFTPGGPNAYWDTIRWRMSSFLLDRFRPVADFMFEKNGQAVTFTSLSSDITHTEWNFGDGNTGNGLQTIHTYSVAGTYKVKLTVYNRNLAEDTISEKVVVSGFAQISEFPENNIRIFPNPFNDRIFITGITLPFDVSVYDIPGKQKMVYNNVINNSIDTRRLPPGIYLLRVKSRDSEIVRKIYKVGGFN